MIEKYIDHTLLAPVTGQEQIKKLCAEAAKYGFASVCVNPCHVALCAKLLTDEAPKVCTVIGFPLGANATEAKVFEAKLAVSQGAHELDMVINIGALKEGRLQYVHDDIAAVVDAVRGKTVKVIIETCLLSDEEKVIACELARDAGAHFVKTSTGFSFGGATAADVTLMRSTVGDSMGVKASGGIRDYDVAIAILEAGATRIGASAGVAIAEEENAL